MHFFHFLSPQRFSCIVIAIAIMVAMPKELKKKHCTKENGQGNKNKANCHKLRAPSLQRWTDRPTDRPTDQPTDHARI